MEQTPVIIKSDGVRRHLAGNIIQRFEVRRLAIAEMKFAATTPGLAKERYQYLTERSLFDESIDYMTLDPVVYLVLIGEGVIDVVCRMAGATKAANTVPGTIRGDYVLPGTENVIHASDSRGATTKEVARSFPPFGTSKPSEKVVKWYES